MCPSSEKQGHGWTLTEDKDFGELIYRLRKPSKGIVLIRIDVEDRHLKKVMISKLISQYGDRLQGAFVVSETSSNSIANADQICQRSESVQTGLRACHGDLRGQQSLAGGGTLLSHRPNPKIVEIMFYVYAIESRLTGRIYIGQTEDMRRRLQLHNAGLVKSTSKEGQWTLMAIEQFDTRADARWCERSMKKSRGRRLMWLAQHRF